MPNPANPDCVLPACGPKPANAGLLCPAAALVDPKALVEPNALPVDLPAVKGDAEDGVEPKVDVDAGLLL